MVLKGDLLELETFWPSRYCLGVIQVEGPPEPDPVHQGMSI